MSRKRWAFAGGLGLIVATAIMTLGTLATVGTAQAAAPGLPSGAKRLFSFQLIGHPGDYEGGCGSGHRVFVDRNENHGHILIVDENDGWYIAQCDSTGNDTAVIHSDNVGVTSGTASVYIRLLGKPGGQLKVCAKLESVHLLDDDFTGCLLGSFDLTRQSGQSKFGLPINGIFDAEVENIVWNVLTNTDFRNAQIVVVENP